MYCTSERPKYQGTVFEHRERETKSVDNFFSITFFYDAWVYFTA